MGNRASTDRQRLSYPSETDLADFQLTGYIGVGTFGKVYTVLHKGMRREYALKAMCKRRLIRRQLADDVLRGLGLLKTLNHPFIVNLWFSFQDANYIYAISDLLNGGDLAFHLRQQGRFSESRAKLLICELALALDYLHRQCIGHFDVKPANILLDEEGHARLADFSLSKRVDPAHPAASFSGTRPYMAPEILLTALSQLSGYSLDVDWWALGVSFYELLRGRLPYEYPATFSSQQVLNIVCTRPVVMPTRWPSDLISFLRAMLNPDPKRRIRSFPDLCSHPYMSRIIWNNVFEKKMVPIFAPSFAHHHFPTRQHGIRATISAPIRAVHHKGRGGGERQFLHHPKLKERQSSDVASGSEFTPLEEEMAKLNTKFKQFNRFRCDIRPAEARPSLDSIAYKNEKRKESAKYPQSKDGSSNKTRAEQLRALYQSNNREVNCSM